MSQQEKTRDFPQRNKYPSHVISYRCQELDVPGSPKSFRGKCFKNGDCKMRKRQQEAKQDSGKAHTSCRQQICIGDLKI